MTPGKVVRPNKTDSFADFRDFEREGETTGSFKYNPAAEEITDQHGDFQEDFDANLPEKM